MINFYYEEVSDKQIDENIVKSWISNVITSYNSFLGSITYIFCNDDYILDINNQYLNHNYYTDIITFDYCENNTISGDLFISLDTVLTNSQQFNTSYNEELHRVIVHGILHLLGFKDKTEDEAKIMRQKENEALKLLETIS
ncbi:rRNA maturation RNase YbeY [Plebeiibacterium sediminum]|uniref:Endoribonuclease YbeY n=1 Tax=Plebeiibacterium sediminum TaxID=2992112 RepID=A0AAE3SEJ3_9BACT|nr:rRNA maturation RNase YbeY [Plebeiobacterium sediminum]MCW3785178.1 rRNA maturation RNase YbeY [Plebeiobacterium sediminum]